jgi:hypothetical protein
MIVKSGSAAEREDDGQKSADYDDLLHGQLEVTQARSTTPDRCSSWRQ